MTLGERIKKIRKEKDLTQQQFCNRIGFKQNSISLVESGKRNISDQAIKSICREFNISEEWLRTGKGDMFLPEPETAIDELVQEHGLDDLDRQILKEFLELSDQDRKAVRMYIQSIINTKKQESIERENAAVDANLEREADAFAAIARQQFLSEKLRESQASSAKTSGGPGGAA